MKSHAVTMYEVGKLADESLDDFLAELAQVRFILFYNNNTIDNKGLKYCKNLKILNLYFNNKITDEGLHGLENLENLNLGNNNSL